MAEAAANTHPGSKKKPDSKLLDLLKSNPFGVFLSAMFLLALIVPARKRKYKPVKRRVTRRHKKPLGGSERKISKKRKTKRLKRPARPVKKITGSSVKKPVKKTTRTTRTRRRSGSKPARFVKGSPEARSHMAKLRAMRGKK